MIDTNPPIEKRIEKTKEISCSGKSFKYENKIYKFHSCTPAIIHVEDEDGEIMNFDVFSPIIDKFVLIHNACISDADLNLYKHA